MSEKPDIDQLAHEWIAEKNGAKRRRIRNQMNTLHNWDKVQDAIRRAIETRKLMGL